MSDLVTMPDLGATLSGATTPMTLAQAEAIARDVYGIVATASMLTSERDQNFLLKSGGRPTHVLKVTHPAEDPDVTDFQTKIQLHVMRPEFALPVPRLVPTRDGDAVHWHVCSAMQKRAVRLITFIDGIPMSQTIPSSAERHALGRVLAQFDRSLEAFDHPQAGHVLLWDLQHAPRLKELLRFVDDSEKLALAMRCMNRFEERVQPRLKELRSQVIHNDLNQYNVLMSREPQGRIVGLLDFGDMVRAPLVQDLAVACAYQLDNTERPLDGAAECAAGYAQLNPLTAEEWDILPDLIAARHLITVLITGWRAQQYPENSAYILRNNPLSWRGLNHLKRLGGDAARDIFIEAGRKTPRSEK